MRRNNSGIVIDGIKMKNKKHLGQHWLKNRAILDEIATLAANERSVDEAFCLEIGPGLGTLTSSLLKRFSRVVAIEFDAELARKLPGQFPGKNLTVMNRDILSVTMEEVFAIDPKMNTTTHYVVAGNIPYYITQPIIRKFLQIEPKPDRIVLLMQKEVAERLAAEPGDLSFFAVFAQNLAEVTLGPVVPACEFTPPPKVDSQVLILEPRKESVITDDALRLAKQGFSSPRKKLVSNLANSECGREEWRQILIKLNLNPDARAEDLDLIDWQELASAKDKNS